RIEERRDQTELSVRAGGIVNEIKIRVEAIDGFRQHRVAETINRVRKFGDDRRVDGGVVGVGREEFVDVRVDGTRELCENEVLVLHFRAEAAGLEKALTVPDQALVRLVRVQRAELRHSDWLQQPLIEERNVMRLQRIGDEQNLGLVDQTVV